MCSGGEVLASSSVVEAEPSPPSPRERVGPDPPTMKMRSWVVVVSVGQSGGPEKQWEQGQHVSVSEDEKRSQWPDSGWWGSSYQVYQAQPA